MGKFYKRSVQLFVRILKSNQLTRMLTILIFIFFSSCVNTVDKNYELYGNWHYCYTVDSIYEYNECYFLNDSVTANYNLTFGLIKEYYKINGDSLFIYDSSGDTSIVFIKLYNKDKIVIISPDSTEVTLKKIKGNIGLKNLFDTSLMIQSKFIKKFIERSKNYPCE